MSDDLDTDLQPGTDSQPAAPAAEAGDELAQLREQYLRLAADFENFKRRKAQELSDRSRYENETAARALLPVLDNLRRALAHTGEPGADEVGLRHGLEMVL